MWNRKAWLLLLRIQAGKVRFFLPLSLAVLEEAWNALADLARLFNPLIRLPRGLKVTDLFNVGGGLLAGIRSRPISNLVNVETDEVRIKIDLY